MPTSDFQPTFAALKVILQPYAINCVVTQDGPQSYSLDSKITGPNGNPLFFVAAKINKSYVSFYLMPVYMFPNLLDRISPELRKRMQGKSCFNFKAENKVLFKELAALTKQGAARVKAI